MICFRNLLSILRSCTEQTRFIETKSFQRASVFLKVLKKFSLAGGGRDGGWVNSESPGKEKGVILGVGIAVWGVWGVPPGSQMVDTDVVVTDEIGFAQTMIDMTILGNYYAIIVA